MGKFVISDEDFLKEVTIKFLSILILDAFTEWVRMF